MKSMSSAAKTSSTKTASLVKTKDEKSTSKLASLPLTGCMFYISDCDDADRVVISNQINKLGGKISPFYRKDLVCILQKERIDAEITEKAYQDSIPIVRHSWVSTCQKNNSIKFDSLDMAPFFYKLQICLTQIFDVEERNRIQSVIVKNGGMVHANLVQGHVTHLICGSPDGPKYEKAKLWGGIKLVSIDWFYACEKSKRWINETAYLLSNKLAEMQTIATTDNSSSTNQIATRPTGQGTESISMRADSAQSEIASTSQSATDMTVATNKKRKISEILCDIESHLINNVEVDNYPSVESIDRSKRTCFQGCLFYIDGYSAEVKDYIISIILSCGGRISMVICGDVNFAALGNVTTENVKRKFVTHHPTCQFINIVWIFEQIFHQEKWKRLLPSIE